MIIALYLYFFHQIILICPNKVLEIMGIIRTIDYLIFFIFTYLILECRAKFLCVIIMQNDFSSFYMSDIKWKFMQVFENIKHCSIVRENMFYFLKRPHGFNH